MLNVFDSIPSYYGNWKEVSRRKFSDAEKAAVVSNTITRGDYGLSVAFSMVSGVVKYIPLSNRSSKTEGQSVDIETLSLVTLERDGKQALRIEN